MARTIARFAEDVRQAARDATMLVNPAWVLVRIDADESKVVG
jgi:hypothetical protein